MSEPRINLPVSKLEDEIERWKSIVTQHCEDVRECREEAAKVIGDAAHGDSYCVPAIGDLVDMLIAQLAERDAEIERLRHALTEIKDHTACVDDCRVGREGKRDYHARDCTKWIGEIAYAALKGDE